MRGATFHVVEVETIDVVFGVSRSQQFYLVKQVIVFAHISEVGRLFRCVHFLHVHFHCLPLWYFVFVYGRVFAAASRHTRSHCHCQHGRLSH